MRTNGAAHPGSTPKRRWRSGLAAVAATVLAAGTLVAVAAAPAAAATVDTSAWYVLVNRNSGKALDVYGQATTDGARTARTPRVASRPGPRVRSGGSSRSSRSYCRRGGARRSPADGGPPLWLVEGWW
jgi:hypothetical protein